MADSYRPDVSLLGDQYKPELRMSVTRGFGTSPPEISESYGLAQMLESAERDLNEYSSNVKAFGSRLDSPQVRQEAKRLRESIMDKLERAKQELQGRISMGKSDIATKRLSEQLSNLFERLKKLVNEEKSKGGVSESQFTGSFSESTDYERSAAPQDQLTGTSNFEALQKQNEDIQNIERDILDLNEITAQLNTMVDEQGETVNKIEYNVEKAATNVAKGSENTKKSAVLKSRNRKLILIISLILAGVVAAIIIFIIIMVAIFADPGRNSN